MKSRLVILLLTAVALLGQTPTPRGIEGVVKAHGGPPVVNARVTVFDANGREIGEATSDAQGAWSVPLPDGHYLLAFEADGFTGARLEDVISPGTARIALDETAAGEVHNAVRYQPVVDLERTHQADWISGRQLMNLPIDRRNYVALAALTPGVALVNDYIGATDAPLVQAPQSGLSFGGNNGRGNIFWLDGGENYINTGGVRTSISQEAVAEFHIDRSNYSAEFGGGSGGIVNIVSKQGGEDIHGSLFGFLRNRTIQARNYFDLEGKQYTRTQAGFTFSAPLRKGRTYIFTALERLQRENTQFVPIGRDRGSFARVRSGQQQLIDFLATTGIPGLRQLSAQLGPLLVTNNFPSTIALFDTNRGQFPFSERFVVGSARIDHRFSDNHNAFLRFNASAGDNEDSQVEGLTAYSRGLISDYSDQTLMLNDTYVISSRLVSESRLMFNRNRFVIGNRDEVGPSLDITGYGYFGKDWSLPSRLAEWHAQLQQNFFYAAGPHSIRFGMDINPVRDASAVALNLGGRFVFGEYLPLGAFLNTITGDQQTASSISALLAASAAGNKLRGSLNVPLTAIQVFNLGIPSFYAQTFQPSRWNGWFQRYNFFVNDVVRLSPSLTLSAGARYELEAAPVLGTGNNIAPRAGLAWAITRDRKTVLRAGYGIYYQRHQSQIVSASETEAKAASDSIFVPLSGLPGSRSPLTGLPVTSADVYQFLSAQGIIGVRPIRASDLIPLGIGPNQNVFQLIFNRPVNFVHTYAEQASLEVERAIGDVSVSVAYNFSRGAHIPRLRDLNLRYGPPGALGEPTLVPRDPLVLQSLILESAANSFYHALIVQAARRFSRRLTLNSHYVFSKSIDETTDINFLPNDSLNARKDRGLSTFDQRHRAVASAVADLPGKLIFAPIVTAASGRPFNVVTGEDFNSRRPAGAGRNIGLGPAFVSVDARLSRSFHLGTRMGSGEGLVLETIAEAFNILNHTNFRRLNNTVGPVTVDDLPRPLTGQPGDVTNPLSFISAFEPRRIQLAVKLRW